MVVAVFGKAMIATLLAGSAHQAASSIPGSASGALSTRVPREAANIGLTVFEPLELFTFCPHVRAIFGVYSPVRGAHAVISIMTKAA